MTKPWIFLLIAIVFEVCGTTSMKLSAGFTKTLPSVLIFVFYAVSFVSLTYCLREFEVSTAYAVWSGLGTFLIAIIGIIHFKESFSLIKAVSLIFIILGVVGVNLSGGHE
jgi:small multidrug resistance pump